MMKFALITGASGGIGKSTAKKLASEGWSLYLHYHRNEEAITTLIEEIKGVDVIPVKADLTSSGGVGKLTEQIFDLDAIVYCSGTSHWGLFQDQSEESMDEMISLHVKSPMLLVQALLPKLVRKKGSIVLMSSIWGQTGASCEVVYSAVKGAQLSFVKALSKEVALSGVRVNAVAPGAVSTNMLSGFTEEDVQGIRDEIPMGELAHPDQIADAVDFLLSPKAAYITGQTLSVNGGWYT
ncbi:SDR family oxidoreductase [Rossellomorea marisflavi]|uniref:elongation factor P 5-aminopentanone reductase n=1 Tax=Rossellomorea marisflavi TaxID=189381 RepID=UPI00296F7B9C|nr:SDR family oxidoreductase [Rossellomorea marisflavi]MDW4526557.1 SDR family oxidoreductase [Rossellomorea marisflavi]